MDATTVAVRAVRDVGTDTVALVLETPSEFGAQPGQFVKLGLTVDGEEHDRFYTLSSADVDGTFEITVGIDPGGELAPHLADLSAGDSVDVSGPFGQSFYDGESRVVVLAGGPGVGPAVGIGERALSDGNEVAIVYEDDDPAHEERLSALSAGGADVFIVKNGALGDAVRTAVGDGDGQVFVYGFADFLDEALDALSETDYDSDEAKVENFG